MIPLSDRIQILVELGKAINVSDERFKSAIQRTFSNNSWFVPQNCERALSAIKTQFLDAEALVSWVNQYDAEENEPQKVGLVMAGNIPLVGVHDVFSVFLSGHIAMIKPSDKDPYLLPLLLKTIIEIEPKAEVYFQLTERLKNFKAVIATGSNNSARYFESYFGKYPNIIRKNRNGVAVLHGNESTEELKMLTDDILAYFGLGCRNVAKIYTPEGYDFSPLLKLLEEDELSRSHNKYRNNYDYNLSIFLLNREKHFVAENILLKEDEALMSRIATVHYSFYNDLNSLVNELNAVEDQIQCTVSTQEIPGISTIKPGTAQSPGLTDYADGVDTMAFLTQLNS